LSEESKEAAEGSEELSLIEELADILEVLYALASSFGHSISDLEAARIEKRTVRGGFEDRIFLQTVTKRVAN
jgi:predicted house-cleaning noncanonical NTP pyrophosphatase (MazG superfamily)